MVVKTIQCDSGTRYHRGNIWAYTHRAYGYAVAERSVQPGWQARLPVGVMTERYSCGDFSHFAAEKTELSERRSG